MAWFFHSVSFWVFNAQQPSLHRTFFSFPLMMMTIMSGAKTEAVQSAQTIIIIIINRGFQLLLLAPPSPLVDRKRKMSEAT